MKGRVAILSVLVNFILAFGKIFVGFIARSSSVLADGIHSGMDVLASGISYFGIKMAKKPVDKKHPYGHYKFEVLAGIIITIILFFTGLGIIYEAYRGLIEPKEVSVGTLSLGVMLFSALVNEVMARIKIHYGKKENSISLLSDGVHSRADVFTSLAVVVGLLLTKYWSYADSLLAILIGAYIIKESVALGKEATDSLLDVSAGEEVENKIREIARREKIDLEELKTQKKGSVITANLKIRLPKNLSVEEASKISEHLRKCLVKEIENLEYVAIQIESHDVSSNYFHPSGIFARAGFGRGFGWQRRGRMKEIIGGARGAGPLGYCVCKRCGYRTKHQRGVPCSTLNCPKCGGKLVRE